MLIFYRTGRAVDMGKTLPWGRGRVRQRRYFFAVDYDREMVAAAAETATSDPQGELVPAWRGRDQNANPAHRKSALRVAGQRADRGPVEVDLRVYTRDRRLAFQAIAGEILGLEAFLIRTCRRAKQ